MLAAVFHSLMAVASLKRHVDDAEFLAGGRVFHSLMAVASLKLEAFETEVFRLPVFHSLMAVASLKPGIPGLRGLDVSRFPQSYGCGLIEAGCSRRRGSC